MVVVTVDAVRRFAMTLPRTTEGLVGGRVKFYVGRIVYVSFSRDETVMGFAFPKEERDWLVGGTPDKFMQPSTSDLRYHWVLVRMAAIDRIGDAGARTGRVAHGGAEASGGRPRRTDSRSDLAGSAAGRRRQPLEACQQSPPVLSRNLLQGGRQSDQVQDAVLPYSGDSRIGEDDRKLALVHRIAVAGEKATSREALDLLRR